MHSAFVQARGGRRWSEAVAVLCEWFWFVRLVVGCNRFRVMHIYISATDTVPGVCWVLWVQHGRIGRESVFAFNYKVRLAAGGQFD